MAEALAVLYMDPSQTIRAYEVCCVLPGFSAVDVQNSRLPTEHQNEMGKRRQNERISQQAIQPGIRRVMAGSAFLAQNLEFGELSLEHFDFSLGVVQLA